MQRAIQFLRAMQRLQLVIRSGGVEEGKSILISDRFSQLSGLVHNAPLDPETEAWRDQAISDGGTFTSISINTANDLILAIKATSFDSKVKYILPLLGGNLATALVPLRDKIGAGVPTNTNFEDDDFDEHMGLTGDGATQMLDANITPNDLGSDRNGGYGVWANSVPFGGVTNAVMGMLNNPGGGTRVFAISLAETSTSFEWNQAIAGRSVVFGSRGYAAHYLGQRASASLRELYRDGTLLGQSTVSDPADGIGNANIRFFGVDATNVVSPSIRYWKGRIACIYLTDGSMTQNEAYQMHSILVRKLMIPTGRPRV